MASASRGGGRGGAGGGNDGQRGSSQNNSSQKFKSSNYSYQRHTREQIHVLETFFKENPHPHETQRKWLGEQLGLESKQIKCWFQNKRILVKMQSARIDNSTLRTENERLVVENEVFQEALKNMICSACSGPQRQQSLQELRSENIFLKKEYERISNLFASNMRKPTTQPGTALDGSPMMDYLMSHMNPNLGENVVDNSIMISDVEKANMLNVAVSAMNEIIRVLQMENPLWIISPVDGRYIIDRDIYKEMFPNSCRIQSSNVRDESSKDSWIVTLAGSALVDLFLDSDKWANAFSSIVTNAKTLQVIAHGKPFKRRGSLHLMHGEMHVLSPMVPTREFYFLRFCQQIDVDVWVIVDVSYDCFDDSSSRRHLWKLPSGCLIQDLSHGCSKVTWVEHVEVDDKTQIHRLYRDLLSSGVAYGAQRWLLALDKACEKLATDLNPPSWDFHGVISSPDARKSMIKLSHRMVKNFCETLSVASKAGVPQTSRQVDHAGIRFSVRFANALGQPKGSVVTAATSLWLPIPSHQVLAFLKDDTTRFQWDILSNDNQVNEIGRIALGVPNRSNVVSLIRPLVPSESNMVILQEINEDPFCSYMIYAPLDIANMDSALNGLEDISCIPLLPSGFTVSGDGRSFGVPSRCSSDGGGGSLLTVMFQIFVAGPSSMNKELNLESVSAVNALISSTVQKIKTALYV